MFTGQTWSLSCKTERLGRIKKEAFALGRDADKDKKCFAVILHKKFQFLRAIVIKRKNLDISQ